MCESSGYNTTQKELNSHSFKTFYFLEVVVVVPSLVFCCLFY